MFSVVPWLLALTAATPGVIVVCPEAWRPALNEWQAHRAQQGYRVHWVRPGATAEDTRDAIRQVIAEQSEASRSNIAAVMLAGDAPSFQEHSAQRAVENRVPTFYVPALAIQNFGSEQSIASDAPYGDLDGDGQAEAPVGRIPAGDATQLAEYARRVIGHETARIDLHAAKQLRQIDLVAGVGGFGAITDTVVESATKSLLTQYIPAAYQVSMTYASPSSPYCPQPNRLSQSALARLNDGGMFWVYLGHGFVDTLDRLEVDGQTYPILDRSNLGAVALRSPPPALLFMACYVGAFDARVPCLAEQLVMKPDGPVTVVAASRVTMPYGMAVLGRAMMEEAFDGVPSHVGGWLLRSKQHLNEGDRDALAPASTDAAVPRAVDIESAPAGGPWLDQLASALSPAGHSLTSERRDHQSLFNLLGDPLVHPPWPKTIAIEAPANAIAGSSLTIRGRSPCDGPISVQLVYPRDRLPDAARKLQTQRSPVVDRAQQQQALYEAANNTLIEEWLGEAEQGQFILTVPLNPEHRGRCVLQVIAADGASWAVGSHLLRIEKGSSKIDEPLR